MIAFITGILSTLTRAWAAMLLIGGLHHDAIPALPAFGWWPCLGIVILIDVLFSGAVADGLSHHRAVYGA